MYTQNTNKLILKKLISNETSLVFKTNTSIYPAIISPHTQKMHSHNEAFFLCFVLSQASCSPPRLAQTLCVAVTLNSGSPGFHLRLLV